jgi:hypothetical protein
MGKYPGIGPGTDPGTDLGNDPGMPPIPGSPYKDWKDPHDAPCNQNHLSTMLAITPYLRPYFGVLGFEGGIPCKATSKG